MSRAAGKRKAEASLQRHLKGLRVSTPQQQQLTADALCEGVAARDPAWVASLAQVVTSAPRSLRAQLAARPGLMKDLAHHLAHVQLSERRSADPQPPAAAAGPCSRPPPAKRSSSRQRRRTPGQLDEPAGPTPQQQQQQDGSSGKGPGGPPSSSRREVETAVGLLCDLLQACEPCDLLPYQDVGPVLQMAVHHDLISAAGLVRTLLPHYMSDMIRDEPLLDAVMQQAGQGKQAAVAALANLVPQAYQQLGEGHPMRQQLYDRLHALYASGTTAASLYMELDLLSPDTFLRLPGMWDAACSGLKLACSRLVALNASTSSREEAAGGAGGAGSSSEAPISSSSSSSSAEGLRDAHTACIGYLHELVTAARRLACTANLLPGGRYAAALLLPLGQALQLLLEAEPAPLDPGAGALDQLRAGGPYRAQNCAWRDMQSLSSPQQAAELLAALFQQQPGLLDTLAGSWSRLLAEAGNSRPEETDGAVHLAKTLLVGGGVPGQEERRQHRELLVAAVQLWDRASPDYWRGRPQQLMELIQLPHGPAAVARAGALLEQIFSEDVLGPDHTQAGWELLLAAPDFGAELVDGVACGGETALLILYEVWSLRVPAHSQALAAMPGLGQALAACCQRDEDCPGVDDVLCELLYCEEGQGYLAQHPALVEALVARLSMKKEYALPIWEVLADWEGADEWLLQQPGLLEGLIRALVVADSSWDTNEVVDRLRGEPAFMEALLRQPRVVEQLLRVLVRRYCHPQPPGGGGDRSTQLLLVEGLATPPLAARAMALLLEMLAQGDAELSAGVFEAMNLIQRSADPTVVGFWGGELAATSSRAAPVQKADEELLALHKGRSHLRVAVASAAVATLKLRLKHLEDMRARDAEQVPEGSQQQGRGPKGRRSHTQQQAAHADEGLAGHASHGQGSSSSRQRGGRKGAAGQRGGAAAGAAAPGRQPRGAGATAAAAGGGGAGGQAGVVPPAAKRTRR